MFKMSPLSHLVISLGVTGFMANTSVAQVAISSEEQRALTTATDLAINSDLQKNFLKVPGQRIPYHFNVPMENILPLPANVRLGAKNSSDDPVVVFDYVDSNPSGPEYQKVGMRLLAVRDDSRQNAAKSLAASGLIQDGDIILTFRPNWFPSIRYGSVQLGVSHAGMAYIEGGYLKNLDLPMDDVHVGKNNYLKSEHYQSTSSFHVLRPRGLSNTQRVNVGNWMKLMHAQSYQNGYKRLIEFNPNYGEPNYGRMGMEVAKKVGTIIKTGRSINGFKVFCSEFAWALLSLKNCDPTANESAVKSCLESKVTLESAPFEPLPMVGNIDNGVPGIIDGPAIIAKAMKLDQQTQAQVLQQEVFEKDVAYKSSVSATIIGTNHQTVEKQMEGAYNQVIAPGRQMWDDLRIQYLSPNPQIAGGINALQIDPTDASMQRRLLTNGPASFLVHAQLSDSNPTKSMDYVGTIVFVKSVEDYKKLKLRASEK